MIARVLSPQRPAWIRPLVATLVVLFALASAVAQESQPLDEIYGPAAPEASRGGEVVVGIVYEPPALDPVHQQADATTAVTVLMYQGLAYTDWDGTIRPMLATGWSASEDGLTWTFELRKGVTFHNGHELTAADVKYSYDYIRSEGCGCAGSVYLNAVDSIEVVDDYTVAFHLSSRNSAILAGVADKLTAVFPEGYFDGEGAQARLNQKSVGTGPFILEQFIPNQSIRLVRNPNYWQPTVPYLDAITFVSVPDGNTLLNGLRTGQIDLAQLARPQDIVQLAGVNGLSHQEQASWVQKSLDLQAGGGVTAEKAVRQAISLAVDKGEILQAAVQGYGQVIGLVPAGMQERWGAPLDELPMRGPDPERARELLAEAGYPDGVDIQITTIIGFDWMTPAAEALASQLAEAGIRTTIQRQDLGVWINNWGARAFVDITLNDWGTVPDPSLLFDAHFQMRPVGNDFRNWNNEEATKLFTRAKQATEYDDRYELYAEAQKMMAEEAITIPLFSSSIVAVTQDRLHNYVQHPSGWYFGLIRTWVE
ncbi:MAG TPA: ABC transporter substrate-binding protein [Trueperaceae bacterium]|nr:ABC transporter substrate-binding protein [Trueperaceae bacterium]